MKIMASARFTPRSDSGRFIEAVIVPAARRACQDVGQIILAEAQEIVPVDTGELRASGVAEVRDGDKTVIADVSFNAAHAVFVEYGTGRRGAASPGAGPYPYNPDWPGMPAQPYLRPALEKVRQELVGEFAARMRF